MIVAALGWPAPPLSSQSATVTTAGGVVRVRAPGLRFIDGEPLARLKDGRAVRVDLALDVLADPRAAPTAQKRQTCVLSYDLWEERFAVTTVEKRAESVSHLALAAAEEWCVEQLTIPIKALGSLGRDLPFWVRLEYRILDEEGTSDPADTRYTLGGLIDALSRRRKTDSSTHALESGPFRLPTH